MKLNTLFTKTAIVGVAKIVAGIALIAFGHTDGGAALIGSGFGNIATRDAITKVAEDLKK